MKAKIAFRDYFAVNLSRDCTLSSKSDPTKLLLQELRSASEHQAAGAVECVAFVLYLDLFCDSISEMCSKVIRKA